MHIKFLIIILPICFNLRLTASSSIFYKNNAPTLAMIKVIDEIYFNSNQFLKLEKLKHSGKSAGSIYSFSIDKNEYLIKKGLHRILGRNTLKQNIHQFGLKKIKLPQKWIYHHPNKPKVLHDNHYSIIVEKINFSKIDLSKLNFAEANELAILAMSSNYYDLHDENIVRSNGYIYIIDTEPSDLDRYSNNSKLKETFFDHLNKNVQIAIKCHYVNHWAYDGWPFLHLNLDEKCD